MGELSNLSRTTINQSQRDLINLLDKAEIRVSSGVQSYTSAICDVLDNYAQKGIMRLTQQTLMHEVRETPSPLDGQHITVNPPRFMWPDKFPHLGAVLDGVEEEDYKPEVTYRIRIARDPEFKSEVITAERKWAFFNPFKLFEKGKWYWQHAYVNKEGKEEW